MTRYYDPEPDSHVVRCDACGHVASGFSRRELLGEGWRWNPAGRWPDVVVCGACNDRMKAAA